MTCRDVVGLLIEYREPDFLPERREWVDTHLSRCDDCVAYVRQYEQTVRLARAAFSSDL